MSHKNPLTLAYIRALVFLAGKREQRAEWNFAEGLQLQWFAIQFQMDLKKVTSDYQDVCKGNWPGGEPSYILQSATTRNSELAS